MNQNLRITFSPAICAKIPGLKLGILCGKHLTVSKDTPLVSRQFQDLEKFIKNKFADMAPSADPVVSAVRRVYRRIGWEPTQYRPSSEAMIRRFLKDKGLYRINNLVDLGNVASTRYHLPMGLYDLEKIEGTIVIDVGKESEAYQGISKELIHATGKLILRDDRGIFGNPTADSARTKIEKNTTQILVIFFLPPETGANLAAATLNYLQSLYQEDCPQAVFNQEIISAA